MKKTCFSIGYQGMSLEALCSRLKENGVHVLVDVRDRAWSQRPDFRKGKLSDALQAHGIAYLHYKAAGNPFRPRKGEVMTFRECGTKYRNYLRTAPAVVEELAALAGKKKAAFFCYEARTKECHRGILIKAIQRTAPNMQLVEL